MSSVVPIKSRSSVFFERYARAENENMRLYTLLIFLGVIASGLLMGLVCVALAPRPVHYVPGVTTGGISYPGKVPVESVRTFASFWLTGWVNYTPETLKGSRERGMTLLSPSFLSRTRARMAEELERASRDRLSSVFVGSGESVVHEEGGVFEVVFNGERILYMGKEEMSRHTARYVLSVERSVPTEDNPYGLVITDMRKDDNDAK